MSVTSPDPQTPPPASSPRFESLLELQEAHEGLLERVDAAAQSAEPSEEGDSRTIRGLSGELSGFVQRGAATGSVLEKVRERVSAQTLLDYWVSHLKRAGVEARRVSLAPFDAASLPRLGDGLCPYVGLEAFTESAFFFGREEVLQELLTRVAETPLVVVHGASGCGKSSLVLGGLAPRLRAEVPPRWAICEPFTPGADPVARLIRAIGGGLGPADGRNERLVAAQKDLGALARLLRDAELPLFIIVDQFEEVFTLTDDLQRGRFTAALGAVLEADTRHRVLLTVRQEFHDKLFGLAGLVSYLKGGDFSVRPMDAGELRAAIEGPAAKVNLNIDRQVVDRLVNDVVGQAAAPPLLQFTLKKLWANRPDGRNRITRETLDKVGGPLVALERDADEFIDHAIPEVRDEAKRILVELVRVDDLLEPYRQPLPLDHLLAAGRANTREVLESLVKRDLVRIRPGEGAEATTVEIKHEALLRNWPQLLKWIVEKRKSRASQLALSQAARSWAESGKPADGLYRGWQLREALEFVDLSPLQQEFLAASQADSERELREATRIAKKRLVALLLVIGVCMAVIGVTVLIENRMVSNANTEATKRADAATKRADAATKRAEKMSAEADAATKRAEKMSAEAEAATTLAKMMSAEADASSVVISSGIVERSNISIVDDASQFAYDVYQALKGIEGTRISFTIAYPQQQVRASALADALREQGVKVVGVSRVASPFRKSLVLYYDESMYKTAEAVAELLRRSGIEAEPSKRTLATGTKGLIELWLGSEALSAYDIVGKYLADRLDGGVASDRLVISIGAVSRSVVDIAEPGSWSPDRQEPATFDGKALLARQIHFVESPAVMDLEATYDATTGEFLVTYRFSTCSDGVRCQDEQKYRWTRSIPMEGWIYLGRVDPKQPTEWQPGSPAFGMGGDSTVRELPSEIAKGATLHVQDDVNLRSGNSSRTHVQRVIMSGETVQVIELDDTRRHTSGGFSYWAKISVSGGRPPGGGPAKQ